MGFAYMGVMMGAKRMYRVMIRAIDGTWRLSNDTWEQNQHVVTWAYYDNEEEATAMVTEMRQGNRSILNAWIEEVETK